MEERIIIVQICVDMLVTKVGNLYPTADEKEKLAISIVHYFPCLAVSVWGVSSHCHFFNKKSNSYIETRLKTLRGNLTPSKRKRKPRSSGTKVTSKAKVVSTEEEARAFEEDKIKVFEILIILSIPKISCFYYRLLG